MLIWTGLGYLTYSKICRSKGGARSRVRVLENPGGRRRCYTVWTKSTRTIPEAAATISVTPDFLAPCYSTRFVIGPRRHLTVATVLFQTVTLLNEVLLNIEPTTTTTRYQVCTVREVQHALHHQANNFCAPMTTGKYSPVYHCYVVREV